MITIREMQIDDLEQVMPVSYTHLTLPTIHTV